MLRNVDGAEDQDSSNPPASPSPSKSGKTVGLRKSPRHRKPVRIVPSSKRTDATIAKQLLQRAKKGAQKRLEKEAVAIGGTGTGAIEAGIRKTQLKNIRQFIMPVVSTVSLRIIKTPKRFIEDEGSFVTPPPHMKMARLETTPSSVSTSAQPTSTTSSCPSPAMVSSTLSVSSTGTTTAPIDTLPPPPPPAPTPSVPSTAASLLNNNSNNAANGRFSSSAASCGSSALSQHSSQLSSAESSRSSSPSLDDSSCDSQASEATQALSDPEDHSPSSQGEREANLLHSSRPPSPPSEPEPEQVLTERSRRGRRGQGVGRGSQSQRVRESLTTGAKKPIISPPTGVLMSSSSLVNSQQASSTASSSSSPPPPPLLTPPQPQSASSNTAAISEHHPQSPWISHPIPPFLPGPSVLSSLSDKRSRSILREPTFRWTSLTHPEHQYFSSAKYAKEGLIRKPIFDNFRPPPLTAEDVGLLPQGGAGGAAPVAFPAPGNGAGTGTRLFAPHHQHSHHQHQSSSRFDAPHQKRSPLLRAPRFTPSEAHSRIFESVTLQSSSGSSPGSLSPHQTSSSSSRSSRRRRRLVPGPPRGHPRSPSHSMTRRSSQMGGQMSVGKGSSDMSVLAGSVSSSNPSSLPGVSANPLATSALTPASFSTFSTVSMSLASQGAPDNRRGAAGNPPPLSTTSSSSSPLFPLFPSSAQDTGRGAGKGGKEKSLSSPLEPSPKEKERDSEKNREKEKENKREGRKDLEKRSKVPTPDGSPNAPSSLFTVDGRDSEDAVLSLAPKKAPGRKKSTSVDMVSDTASSEVRGPHSTVPMSIAKGRLSKKGRPSEKGTEIEDGEKEKEKQSAPSQQTASLPGQPGRQQLPVSSVELRLAQAEKQPVTDKRVVGLLKKAKAQLFEIKKSKLKPADQTKVQVSVSFHVIQGQESDSSETSVRGPRIKHVCRRAAVALGRNRAVFPDDMPTLSALPWEEREKILSSMGNDGESSVAGSEEAEPQSPPLKPRETRQKSIQEAPPKKGRRSRRCGQCSGCQVPEDCGVCTNCLDKPKFGGRNIKKQCCKRSFLAERVKLLRSSWERRSQDSSHRQSNHLQPSHLPPTRLNPFSPQAQSQPRLSLLHSLQTPNSSPSRKPLTAKPPSSSTLNWLSTPSTRGPMKPRAPCDGVHRIRVDFKRDHDVEKVWEAGGLSLLTSVPVTPRVLCFLCASSGNVEFVFCQVCCEPFHLFCLGESERPLQEQFENWCCRRCRFCQACGRQHQKTKQLLECDKCRNSYHPECLGPNHPNRPTKKKRVWVCTKCVRCKSCGATKPGKSWDAQWSHDFSMCHDCAKLFAKGNFCPLCDKCYDDDDYDSKMMECGRCNHWVHAKCENLTDEMYELLSKLPESVAYTCTKCTERHPAEWRTALERELQGCVRHVLTALLNSRTSSHLLRYRQVGYTSHSPSDSPPDLDSGLLPNAVLPPSLDHNYAQWQERQELSHSPELPPPPGVGDNRQCVLCLKYGDENTNEGGRLLYIGQNEWTHVNCALWSAEVFEDDDGSLKNVHMAVLRGKQLRCEKCQKPGATVGCCLTSCTSNYHFMCARQCHCVFLEDKKVYCPKHRDLIKGEVVSGFEVTRRILVDLEGISLRRKWLAGLEPENVHMMIGSMTIDCLGILTELSDCKRKLFPVGYQCSRVYWSTLDARKRCVYTCRILVCHPPVVESDLKNMMAPEENRTIAHSPPSITEFPDPFESPRRSDTLSPANTPKLRVYTRNRHPSYPPCQRSLGPRPMPSPEAWKSLTDKVQEARSNARLKELSFEGVNGLRMLGIVHEAVVFLLEQLYGSRHCRSYRFRFHKPEETDEPPINPHGTARAEISHRRSVFDMFNFLASKHRQPPEYRPHEDDDDEGQLRTARRASMELPLTVRFRQLKATSKETVGVYRSPIHGRGLFCKKTIDAGEMVIEYSGNVIRSVLTDKREKYYDGKGIGCYMFRIDDYEVVDATMHGNAARFINHSCEPNCYSRVITVDGQKHIVIFASRRIYCGEELTYDYKFPIEDASNKLPCNCGAKKCRKFLN
uniref:[histone H3]-lysine(4) N-methyltransferase n=1 Tax=Sparus aurata TaxID=8175 RepID=A0A671WR88_SPAAU